MMKREAVKAGGDARAARRLRRTSNALEWRDVISSTCVVGADVLDARGITQLLPLSLLRDGVFQFLAPPLLSANPQRAIRDGFDSKQYAAQLAPLRVVCQHWYTLAQFLLLESKKLQPTVTFKKVTEQERKRVLREAKKNGSMAKELTVEMNADAWYGSQWAHGNPSMAIEPWFVAQFWEDLFQCYPDAERLDISRIDAQLLDPVLTAAYQWLPKVHALILPRTQPPNSTNTLSVVVEALGRWHATNGGLRVLTVPDWIVKQDNLYADFVAAVAQFCPRIEYFVSRVPKRLNPLYYQVTRLPLPVWADFCHKCPLLREFSWKFAPYTKQYTDIFVRPTGKPQLEMLHLELRFLEHGSVVPSVATIQSMVAQLPTLRSFEFNKSVTPRNVVFSMAGLDDLLRQLATSCPQLEAFLCQRSTGDDMLTISSTAIQTLTKNTKLHKLHVNFVQFHDGGDGSDGLLVELLKNVRLDSSTATGGCLVEIKAVDSVNTAVLKMLKYLAQTPHINTPFAHTKAKLQFRVADGTRNGRYADPSFSQEPPEKNMLPSRQELTSLVEKILARYANTMRYLQVIVRTHISGPARSFDTIEKVTLLVNVDPHPHERTNVADCGGVYFR